MQDSCEGVADLGKLHNSDYHKASLAGLPTAPRLRRAGSQTAEPKLLVSKDVRIAVRSHGPTGPTNDWALGTG